MILRLRGRTTIFPRRPLVMGIVNLTDDSFSGDGSLQVEQAVATARGHVSSWADIIDIGGETARTNRPEISAAEESSRILPFLSRFQECHLGLRPVDQEQLFPPALSINTWRPEVAEAALQVSGDLLNDISGLPTVDNAMIAAKYGAGLLIMHLVGLPKQPHATVGYSDILCTLGEFFARKIEQALAAGMTRESIVLDPGIDFAKQKSDNLRIFRELGSLKRLGRPLLVPVSRKTVIGDVLGIPEPANRDAGTVACVVAGTLRGASIFRVHNVHAVVQTLRVIYPIVTEQLP